MEPASPSGDGVFHAAIAVAGALCALGMCVGALGPWARTPVISFSGWAGIGFPLVILAFVILAIQVLHGFVPRRAWLVLNLLLGAFTLVCAIVLALLESVLSRVGSLVAFIFARRSSPRSPWLGSSVDSCLGDPGPGGDVLPADAGLCCWIVRQLRRLSATQRAQAIIAGHVPGRLAAGGTRAGNSCAAPVGTQRGGQRLGGVLCT